MDGNFSISLSCSLNYFGFCCVPRTRAPSITLFPSLLFASSCFIYFSCASFLIWPRALNDTMDGINGKQKWINVHRILNMLLKLFWFCIVSIPVFRLALCRIMLCIPFMVYFSIFLFSCAPSCLLCCAVVVVVVIFFLSNASCSPSSFRRCVLLVVFVNDDIGWSEIILTSECSEF